MDIFRSAGGLITLEVISADLSSLLGSINRAGIEILDLKSKDSLTVVFTVHKNQYRKLCAITTSRGDQLTLVGNTGLYWLLKRLVRRPVLMIGCTILMFLSLFLPSRVLFVRIEGNDRIPGRYIAEMAEGCGIGFGASRREVRSERTKNRLLDAIPQLQWAGINTYGCVAVISVRERSEPPAISVERSVSSIVAARDGVIHSCTVTKGSPVCIVGQAVVKGQVLISGFTDCGLCIQAGNAEGEVMALTNRSLSACTPEKTVKRQAKNDSEKKFSLIVGKFRINFYKDSGILDTTCVKMYSENYMTLPGGFQLPIALAVEELIYCESAQTDTPDNTQTLTSFAKRYLQSQMTAGQILRQQEDIQGCSLEGEYACLEMIGQVRYEESITENENR